MALEQERQLQALEGDLRRQLQNLSSNGAGSEGEAEAGAPYSNPVGQVAAGLADANESSGGPDGTQQMPGQVPGQVPVSLPKDEHCASKSKSQPTSPRGVAAAATAKDSIAAGSGSLSVAGKAKMKFSPKKRRKVDKGAGPSTAAVLLPLASAKELENSQIGITAAVAGTSGESGAVMPGDSAQGSVSASSQRQRKRFWFFKRRK